jgi:hypothetical protein
MYFYGENVLCCNSRLENSYVWIRALAFVSAFGVVLDKYTEFLVRKETGDDI